MLVLSRKKNESVIVNDNIEIVVIEIRGDKVRLGINAPKEVPVHRKEVYDAIRRHELDLPSGGSADCHSPDSSKPGDIADAGSGSASACSGSAGASNDAAGAVV